MDIFAPHPDFYLRLDADPFVLELHTQFSLQPPQPQHLLSAPPPSRHLSHYRPIFEDTTEHYRDARNQVSCTCHWQSHRTNHHPHPSHPLPTIVLAHIYSLSSSTRTRITISGRPRIRDVVRQLLGHAPEARYVVSIKKRGTWQTVGLEVKIEDAEQEVEIKIVTDNEARHPRVERRWFERDSSGERVVRERWF